MKIEDIRIEINGHVYRGSVLEVGAICPQQTGPPTMGMKLALFKEKADTPLGVKATEHGVLRFFYKNIAANDLCLFTLLITNKLSNFRPCPGGGYKLQPILGGHMLGTRHNFDCITAL